jgi:hypothetical protein
VADRYFTPTEANELLATVRPLVDEMVAHRRALAQAATRRAELSRLVAGNGGGVDADDFATLDEEATRAAAEIARLVSRIQGLGILVKDLDRGLVDFPAMRGDEEVLLCWELGEDEVGFWHGLEEGFAGRKPLPFD